jgi:predicted ATP-grasp superfamily ATP-dependent carboligase
MEMKLLLFEWLTSGGLLFERQAATSFCSLSRQGNRMCQAVAEDFMSAGCEVVVPVDFRHSLELAGSRQIPVQSGEELPLLLKQISEWVDGLFLIAPESEQRSILVAQWVSEAAGKFLSPGLKWLELCSDKTRCCSLLEAVDVPVPRGQLWNPASDAWPPPVPLPAVLKPNDGCGGEGLKLIHGDWGLRPEGAQTLWRVEELAAGEPLSVIALVGRHDFQLLQPTRQFFSQSNFGEYIGGGVVSEPQTVRLAWRTVERALQAMEGITGVIGFDLIIDFACKRALVVEVNPRLTSSYIGLRAGYATNLMENLLALQRGETPAPLLQVNTEMAGLTWEIMAESGETDSIKPRRFDHDLPCRSNGPATH